MQFQNLRKTKFKPAVLETYNRRFRQAVASYLNYLEDPGGWKPRMVERTPAEKPAANGNGNGNGAGH
jgi:hypothetical protein